MIPKQRVVSRKQVLVSSLASVFVLLTYHQQQIIPTVQSYQPSSFRFPKVQIPNFIEAITQQLQQPQSKQLKLQLPKQQQQRQKEAAAFENELLSLIESSTTTDNEVRIQEIIEVLENQYTDISITEPAIAPQIYGRWKLLYSTKPNTASPIQRTAFGKVQQFPIYQDIIVSNDVNDPTIPQLQVNQIIDFGNDKYLTVNALASTSEYPLKELTEQRKTTGTIFGINILGVSLVGDDADNIRNKQPNTCIDFVFDNGIFVISDTVSIPYPVPFRLPILRDWVKGWIVITYLSPNYTDTTNNNNGSGTIRISRGNKGTTFVLQKI